MMEGPWCRVRREARARERHRRWSWWIALKVLDPRRPIREADICGESWLYIPLITTSRARTWRWRRMRRYRSYPEVRSDHHPRQFFLDCTIAMRGYDFRKRHLLRVPCNRGYE